MAPAAKYTVSQRAARAPDRRTLRSTCRHRNGRTRRRPRPEQQDLPLSDDVSLKLRLYFGSVQASRMRMLTRIAIMMSAAWLVQLRQSSANERPHKLEKTARDLVQASILLENRSGGLSILHKAISVAAHPELRPLINY